MLTGKFEYCEAKPKNIQTQSTAKTKRKLDGNGSISDYTGTRLKKDIKSNPTIIIGGFIDGRLFFIFSFKFNCSDLVDDLKKQLSNKLPLGDKSQEYLRSARIRFNCYKNAPDLNAKIFVSKNILQKHEQYFSRLIYQKLLKL